MDCHIRSLTTYSATLAPLFISSSIESPNRMPVTPCIWAYTHDDFYITFNVICLIFYTWLCFYEPTSIPSHNYLNVQVFGQQEETKEPKGN